jgi:hypothetical protein
MDYLIGASKINNRCADIRLRRFVDPGGRFMIKVVLDNNGAGLGGASVSALRKADTDDQFWLLGRGDMTLTANGL